MQIWHKENAIQQITTHICTTSNMADCKIKEFQILIQICKLYQFNNKEFSDLQVHMIIHSFILDIVAKTPTLMISVLSENVNHLYMHYGDK